MSIYQKAVNNPVTTALVFIAFMIFGIFSLMRLSINQLPEFESNYIMVMSSYNGASAPDIETNLSKLLENTLNAVPNLKNLTSTSKENVCVIALEFEYGTDIDEATNDVRDKLDLINSYLPDGASVPVIFKFSADDMPIYIMSATAKDSYNALDKILDDKVATPLARIKGVGTVSVNGAPKREIQVFVDPVKIKAYNLSINTISMAIAYENKNVPSGNLDIGSDTYTIRVEKEFKSADEIKDVVVGYTNGKPIYVRDIAEVVDGVEERSMEVYTNGVRGAQIIIQKQSGANTVNVIKGVKKELEKIKKTLPADIEITPIIDSSRTIINSIKSLFETIIITFLVVMAVVFLFLGRWRATFIILTAIPISLLASLVYLYATGNTLNVVSMSALSIAIGMVVDDAIVVLENVSSHIDGGEKPREAAVTATGEVGISVVASTLTMLAVFLPLTMIQGMAGIMFRQLGWIVSIIMIVSTTGALTLVPMMCSRMLRTGTHHGKAYNAFFGTFNKGVDALREWYGGIMQWSVNHRTAVISIGFAIFIGSLLVFGPLLKTEYLPKSDSGRLTASIELPVGTAQAVTGQLAYELYERWTKEIPEARVISFGYGQADTDNAFGNMQNTGTYILSFNMDIGSVEDRERGCGELADIMRADLRSYPEIKKFDVKEGGGMGMGGASSIAIEIYGYDFDTVDDVMVELQHQLKEEPCFAQILPSREDYVPSYQVNFDREKLALNGLNSTTAASYVTSAINGSTMSFYREDGDEYNIRVRYAPKWRTSVEDIENIDIFTPLGKSVKVSELGTVEEMQTPPSIVRKNRERMVKLTCIVKDGYALSDCVAVSQDAIDRTDIPSEVDVLIAGDYEEQKKTFGDLATLLVLIVILVYMVMASQFESFMTPFVIMMSVPFTVTGVLLGLWMHSQPLGVMALIGVIILMGIVVKNGIVLLDYTIILRNRGMELKEAIVTACKARLRPILMTSLTTILGMLPLAVGTGEGSEMWRGLGITVIWGLTISSLITLVFIPVMYTSFSEAQIRGEARKEQRRLANEAKWAQKQ